MSGNIHHPAAEFFRDRQREKKILRPFLLAGFDVTWANAYWHAGTSVSVSFLKPSSELTDSYGFDYEILLVYSRYNTVEPRALVAVDQVFSKEPAKGRVEPLWYFFVSEAPDTIEWINGYVTEHKESRIAVPFRAADLANAESDEWTVKRHLQKHYLLLDRFKYTLPLREDTYFFGRAAEIGTLLDRIRRSENAGVFGLRKTGKTSVLLKMERILALDDQHLVEHIDAESPDIRRRHWNELLGYIARQILERLRLPVTGDFNGLDAAKHFQQSISTIFTETNTKKLTIVFDEIEWLTPGTARDPHWNEEYLEFWQVLRTVQTSLRGLSLIVAGVNPAVAEESRFGSYQNPMFGIVTPLFLRGLPPAEIKDMVQRIGKLMGLTFQDDSVDYLMEQYAGHPLLTRLACSYLAELGKAQGESFPMKVTRRRLADQKRLRDGELVFYVRHVVDELERFYPAEYALLELLASGGYQEFRSKVTASQAGAHLFRYGVVSDPAHPYVTYEVLKDYVSLEAARREGRQTRYRLVDPEGRSDFLRIRMKGIAEDTRDLERLIKTAEKASLFGPNSFPEAERLFQITPVSSETDFANALSTLNRCLVESIERFGASVGDSRYFWTTIQSAYPDLHDALHRIKVYRHNSHHLELRPGVEAALRRFLERDTEEALAESPDRYWYLFQRTIDELFCAVQKEIARLESR